MLVGVVGINHKIADLKLREKLAKACEKCFSLSACKSSSAPFVLLSTCNRTEIYFSSFDLPVIHSEILHRLRQEMNQDFEQKLYSFFGEDCFTHLSTITAGLDSAIVGETEIQGQVKNAYNASCQELKLPKELHFLFQKSLKIGKTIRTQIQLRKGMLNLEQMLFKIGSELFKELSQTNILFVGASDINKKIWDFFSRKNIGSLSLCNRSLSQNTNDAKSKGIQLLDWSKKNSWSTFDWIIVGTKSLQPLLTVNDLNDTPKKHKLIVDLSIPRNVATELGWFPSISLLNIDKIHQIMQSHNKAKAKSLLAAQTIILENTKKQMSILEKKQKYSTLSMSY